PRQLAFLTVAPGVQCATPGHSAFLRAVLRAIRGPNSFQLGKPRLSALAHGARITVDHGPWTMDHGPRTTDHEPATGTNNALDRDEASVSPCRLHRRRSTPCGPLRHHRMNASPGSDI